jgi:hypothetical protein
MPLKMPPRLEAGRGVLAAFLIGTWSMIEYNLHIGEFGGERVCRSMAITECGTDANYCKQLLRRQCQSGSVW